ncbi:MAG: hypothetical protein JW884_01285, partial [Deltaproteobacteria bacterium]|nr:hypothetical protein [Deltaproteobacteria bacterium]
YHHLGWIVLLEAGEKDIKDETELFIGCKNLSDKEMEVLWREIEMLVGKNVHTFGGEPAVGWFMDDGLRSEDFTAEVIPAKSGIQEK